MKQNIYIKKYKILKFNNLMIKLNFQKLDFHIQKLNQNFSIIIFIKDIKILNLI